MSQRQKQNKRIQFASVYHSLIHPQSMRSPQKEGGNKKLKTVYPHRCFAASILPPGIAGGRGVGLLSILSQQPLRCLNVPIWPGKLTEDSGNLFGWFPPEPQASIRPQFVFFLSSNQLSSSWSAGPTVTSPQQCCLHREAPTFLIKKSSHLCIASVSKAFGRPCCV